MEQNLPAKGEVIITGLGGSGVLTAGILIAEAATTKYKNVTWFPSYAISKRGGLCECTVIFSNDEIASPLLSQADGVIVAEAAQFKDFEGRVRLGGTMIVEKAGLQTEEERKAFRLVEIPAFETAIRLSGTSQGANLILLGAFVMVSQIISPELIRQRVKEVYADREKLLKGNLAAFEEGLNLARNF